MSLDALTRAAERGEDLVAALAARLRAGEVTQERVAYAAALGYEPAQALADPAEVAAEVSDLVGDGSPLPGLAKAERWTRSEYFAALARDGSTLLGHVEAVRWGADCSEYALLKFGSSERSMLAVAAARAWADCPCEEHGQAARAAAWSRDPLFQVFGESSWGAESASWVAAATAATSSVPEAWAPVVCSSVTWAAEAWSAAAWAAEAPPSEGWPSRSLETSETLRAAEERANSAREPAWSLYLGWLAERLCWGPA